jgi:hypothetical protein
VSTLGADPVADSVAAISKRFYLWKHLDAEVPSREAQEFFQFPNPGGIPKNSRSVEDLQ